MFVEKDSADIELPPRFCYSKHIGLHGGLRTDDMVLMLDEAATENVTGIARYRTEFDAAM